MSRTHRPTQPAPKRVHWPENTPGHCYDWITPEEVVRHALAAFYACSRHLDRFPDDPTGEAGEFTNGRYWFAEDLAENFQMRLRAHAQKAGVPGFDGWDAEALRTCHPAPIVTPAISHTHSDMRIVRDIHCHQLYQCTSGEVSL